MEDALWVLIGNTYFIIIIIGSVIYLYSKPLSNFPDSLCTWAKFFTVVHNRKLSLLLFSSKVDDQKVYMQIFPLEDSL